MQLHCMNILFIASAALVVLKMSNFSYLNFFMEVICPSLGTIMASAMFAAPITSLRQALSRGSLGDLNPTPWAFMTGNCLGWVSYSFVTKDLFVLASNLPGLLLSVWLNTGAAKLQHLEIVRAKIDDCSEASSNHNDTITSLINPSLSQTSRGSGEGSNELHLPSFTLHEHWLMKVLIVWGITLSIAVFVPMTNNQQADIIGTVVNLNLIVFYGAPLSTILQVFKTRSSSSIHRRTLVMGVLNSFFWLVYGLALQDMVIFIPNFCGFILSVVQVVLCLIFSKKNGLSEVVVNSRSTSHEEPDGAESGDQNLELL